MQIRIVRFLLIAALLVSVAVTVPSGNVVRAEDVPGLATYAPPDSVLFVSLRTDDAFLDSLDGLVEVLNKKIQAVMPDTMRIVGARAALTILLNVQFGLNFERDVRPVLGDNMALFASGLEALTDSDPTNDTAINVGLVVDIQDRAAATKLVDDLLEKYDASSLFVKGDEATYTIYRPAEDTANVQVAAASAAIAINDNALIIGTESAVDAAVATRAKLFEQPKFTDTLALLPETNYNLLVYVDAAMLAKQALAAAAQQSDSMGTNAQQLETVEKALGAVGQFAFGATILDDRSLTIDAVQTAGDPKALEALGITMVGNTPIDADFAGYVPATAGAFVQFKNPAGAFDNALSSISVMAEQQGQNADEITAQIEQFEAQVLQATGINLREDVLSWLTGNVIVFNGYTIPEPGTPTVITSMIYPGMKPVQPIEQGLIVEVTDAAKAAALVAKIDAAVQRGAQGNSSITVTKEDIGDADAVVVTAQVPVNGSASVPLEIVIAANDQVFVISTRASAEAILTGAAGINSDASYQAAAALAVENPVTFGYLGRAGFTLLGDILTVSSTQLPATFSSISAELGGTPVPTMSPADQLRQLEMQQEALQQAQTMVRTIVSLLDSASVSSGSVGESAVLSRLVLTLAK